MRFFAVALVVLVMMLAVAPPPASAEYEVTRPGAFLGDFFDPNWPGTKLSGPLSILYEFVAEGGDPELGQCSGIEVNLVFVLKLKKGTQSFVFGDRRDSVPGSRICAEGPETQVTALVAFFLGVIDQMFPGNPNAADNTRLKSLTNWIQGPIAPLPLNAGDTLRVSSMDIVLAVKE